MRSSIRGVDNAMMRIMRNCMLDKEKLQLRKAPPIGLSFHFGGDQIQAKYVHGRHLSSSKKTTSSFTNNHQAGNPNSIREQPSPKYHNLQSLSNRMSRIMEKRESPHLLGLTRSRSEEIFNKTIYVDIKTLVTDMYHSINKGLIKASGNDIHIISGICADALHILSILPDYLPSVKKKTLKISPFDTCIQILETVYDLGMDVTPNHIASAIHIACKEGKFYEAANLFQSLYNVDTALSPMDPTLGRDKPLELGFFAMAKVAQQEVKDGVETETGVKLDGDVKDGYVARAVFNAALEMCIISSRDHDTYILGAIAALGRAGEWKACVDYLETDEGKALGQPLVAAVMNACLECNQGSAALTLYEEKFLTNEKLFSLSEWQTGGTYENILPLCRNAALSSFRVIISSNSKLQDLSKKLPLSTQAVNILNNAIEARAQISQSAMESVLFSCAYEGEWEKACSIIEQLIDEQVLQYTEGGSDNSIISGAKTFFSIKAPLDERILPQVTADMLASVMHACNSNKQFGVAIFYSYLSSLLARIKMSPTGRVKPSIDNSEVDQDMIRILISQYGTSKDVISQAIVALCGLEQYEEAEKLYDAFVTKNSKSDHFSDTNNCFEFASELMEDSCTDDNSRRLKQLRLKSIFQKIKVIESSLLSGKISNFYPSSSDEIDIAVANIMNDCTRMNQPMMGLMIGRRLAKSMAAQSNGVSSAPPSVRDDDIDINIEPDFLLSTDSLLSSTMEAYRKLEWDLSFFLELLLEDMNQAEALTWPKSIHQCVPVLIEMGYVDKAYELFCDIDSELLIPQSFLVIARSLIEHERWSEVRDLWDEAKKINCISEELGLLTMKAISYSEFNDEGKKFPLFGEIIWDMAQLNALSKLNWKKSRYWILKEELLQRDVVKLMGWRKGEIKEGELRIALDDFNTAKKLGEKVPENVLMALIRKAGHKQRHVRCRGNPLPDKIDPQQRQQQIKERKEGIANIMDILHEARKTEYGDDPAFTLQVAQGLRALKADKETIQFVKELTSRGAEIRPKTFLQAVFAAKSIQDHVNRDEIIKLMEDSGLTYNSHDDSFRQNYS